MDIEILDSAVKKVQNQTCLTEMEIFRNHARTGAKPSLKIGTANAICWNSLGLFRDYGLNHIFLGIKLF